MRTILSALLIIILFPILLFSDEIVLEHADNLRTSLKGEELIFLNGNVRLRFKSDTLTSDRAEWNRQAKWAKFYDNVWVFGENFKISTNSLTYTELNEFAAAKGDVQLILNNGRTKIYGDEGEYWGDKDLLVMKVNPFFTTVDSVDSERIEVEAQKMYFFMKKNLGIAIGNVVTKIYEKDTTVSPLVLYCDSLEYYTKEGKVYGYGNVIIKKEMMVAECQYAYYDESKETIKLEGDPKVKDEKSKLRGDEMTMLLKDNQISEVIVLGDPEGTYHALDDTLKLVPDSRYEADAMHFYFKDNELFKGFLMGHAKSIYYAVPGDTLSKEWNEASGDSITVWFQEGKMDSIDISGGAVGSYFTERSEDNNIKSDTIKYEGDYIAFSIPNRYVSIEERAKVEYKDLVLTSYNISYSIDDFILRAYPQENFEELPDSLVVFPVLSDDESDVKGVELVYNARTQRGRIITAKTTYKQGYYTGRVLKKSEKNVFYGKNINYTSCDREENPHYHFFSPKFKMITKDKIIPKIIVLYIQELPVLAIPFYVFSIKPGRHSGLLPFKVGRFQKGERFIRDIGYYYAPSDYWDIFAGFDYDEDSGWLFKSGLSYALRYRFSGYLKGSYKWVQTKGWEETEEKNEWDFRISHDHEINPTLKVKGSGNFVSSKSFLQETKDLPQERMERILSSSLRITKTWENSTISGEINRREDLEDETISDKLPSINYRLYTKSVFPGKADEDNRWYNDIQYSYSASFLNKRDISPTEKETHQGLDNNFSLNFPIKFGPYLTLNPNINLDGTLFDRDEDGNKLPFRFVGKATVSANTILYGNFPIKIKRLQGFRHVFNPSLTYSWQPKYKNMDRFYQFGGMGGSASEIRNISFQMKNLVQLKLSEGEKIKKVDLFSISSSGSYNFLADERRLSNISSKLITTPFSFWDINLFLTHSFYDDSTNEFLYLPDLDKIVLKSNLKIDKIFIWEEDSMTSHAWKLNVSHYYSREKVGGYLSKTNQVELSTTLNLTRNWKFDYDYYYNIEDGEKVSERFVIYRDMHCWEARFIWVPTGYRNGYYFRINIKEHPEVKVEGGHGKLRTIW